MPDLACQVTDILEAQQPGVRRCARSIHDPFHEPLDILPVSFKWVLVLLVQLAEPSPNKESLKDLHGTGTEVDLGVVTDEFGRNSPFGDVVFQCVGKLRL